MEYSIWYALAKGDYFLGFLILVVLVLGFCREHYQKAWKDVMTKDITVLKMGADKKKDA